MAPPTDNENLTPEQAEDKAAQVEDLRETLRVLREERSRGHEQTAAQQRDAELDAEAERLKAEIAAELAAVEREQDPTSNVMTARQLMEAQAAALQESNDAAQAAAEKDEAPQPTGTSVVPQGTSTSAPQVPATDATTKTTTSSPKATSKTATSSGDAATAGEGK